MHAYNQTYMMVLLYYNPGTVLVSLVLSVISKAGETAQKKLEWLYKEEGQLEWTKFPYGKQCATLLDLHT
jgi:hypothetical protein